MNSFLPTRLQSERRARWCHWRRRLLLPWIVSTTTFVAACGGDSMSIVPDPPCADGSQPVDGECPPTTGSLTGRVCDDIHGRWVAGATVTLDDPRRTAVTTDATGTFVFSNLPPGDYTLTISSLDWTDSRSASIEVGETTDIGPNQCVQSVGAVRGRICGGDDDTQQWLAEAHVWTEIDGRVIETWTDSDGWFTLSSLPPGAATLHVSRNAFSMEIEVTVQRGIITELPEPRCMPPTTMMAVVTGNYDDIKSVLAELGFPLRKAYGLTGVVEQNPDGNVDTIDGFHTDAVYPNGYWLSEFLADPLWLSQYKIIFFNCGLYDGGLLAGGSDATTAITNLQNFVNNGGSIYVSDWASEVVRLAFPGKLNFWGDDSQAHKARVGVANVSQTAQVVDAGLAGALGKSSVTINFKLPQWVVVDTTSVQQFETEFLVKGNVQYQPPAGAAATLSDSPIIMQFPSAQGRVLYTSAHNEDQITADLQNILYYIVFEL